MKFLLAIVVVLCFAVVASSCEGGSTATLIPAVSQAPVVGAARFAAAAPQVQTATIDQVEQDFLTLMNNYRASLMCGTVPCPAPPVSFDSNLNAAADWMSMDMGLNEYFAHNDQCIVTQTSDCITGHASDNVSHRDPFTRMNEFGYGYNTWRAENIAAGYTSAQAVFDGWKNSPGHDAAMRDKNYKAVGIQRVRVDGSPYTYYWTNDFGGVVVQPTSTPTGGTPSPTKTPSPTLTPTATPTPSPSLTASAPATTPSATPTPTASASSIPTASPCLGDMNNDRQVNGSDLLLFAPHWHPNYDAAFDLNGDGRVNGSDMLRLAPRWGPCP